MAIVVVAVAFAAVVVIDVEFVIAEVVVALAAEVRCLQHQGSYPAPT